MTLDGPEMALRATMTDGDGIFRFLEVHPSSDLLTLSADASGHVSTSVKVLVQPGLTVVAQPTYELGQTAAELLLERIEDPTRPVREIVLEPTLLIRQSCARHG